MQFPNSSYIPVIRTAAYSIPVHFHPSRRKMSSFIYQIPRFLQISFVKEIRHRWVNLTANQYQLDRIMAMGPDFACMEWLMNAGATSVKLSDGTVIGSQKEMRKFLTNQGFDVKKLKTEAPKAQILKHFEQENQLRSSMASDSAYDVRWPHISPIHLKEIDATDAVIDGQGCKYFLECRNIEKLKLNFNDFLTDIGLEELSKGRPARTLKELEMCYVPCISDACAPILGRLHGLQRLHLYAMGGITKRDAVRRLLIRSLPKCRITFPKPFFIGYGYETEEQKAAFQKYYKEEANKFMRWLNDESSDFFATKGGRYK